MWPTLSCSWHPIPARRSAAQQFRFTDKRLKHACRVVCRCAGCVLGDRSVFCLRVRDWRRAADGFAGARQRFRISRSHLSRHGGFLAAADPPLVTRMENTMIQPLRRCHRFTFFALAVLLPALFGAGLIARRPLVNVEATSDRINLIMPNGTAMVADARDLWGKAVDDPDLLVYWNQNETQT